MQRIIRIIRIQGVKGSRIQVLKYLGSIPIFVFFNHFFELFFEITKMGMLQ